MSIVYFVNCNSAVDLPQRFLFPQPEIYLFSNKINASVSGGDLFISEVIAIKVSKKTFRVTK